jgi:hypothetical protein
MPAVAADAARAVPLASAGVFRSRRRELVFPQAEHARVAAAIAQAWGNERWQRPPVPFDAFVRAVALHDRGYGQLDADYIGEVSAERWLEIQRASFAPRGTDPVVDLLVALHVRRLVALRWSGAPPDALGDFDAQLSALRRAAGIDASDAAEADRVMDLCDAIAFDFCVELPAGGHVELVAKRAARAVSVEYEVDGEGLIVLDPWPLGVARLDGLVLGFEAASYPERLAPVMVAFRVLPREATAASAHA